jgi:hypothetical protein
VSDESADDASEEIEPRQLRREFYKSMGLERGGHEATPVLHREEYRDELGGTHAGSNGGFVAALKAYRLFDEEWTDYNPRKLADLLELAPEDYEADGEHSLLLLRRLPPRLPEAARDVL